MAAITEDYVSYEIAKLLKEKGFDEPIQHFYKCNSKELYRGTVFTNTQIGDKFYNAPTLQMAMKWIKEKYCLHFVIQPMMSMPSCELKWAADTYDTSIFYKELSEFKCVAGTELCDSPEEAVEAALKYCLENLI